MDRDLLLMNETPIDQLASWTEELIAVDVGRFTFDPEQTARWVWIKGQKRTLIQGSLYACLDIGAGDVTGEEHALIEPNVVVLNHGGCHCAHAVDKDRAIASAEFATNAA